MAEQAERRKKKKGVKKAIIGVIVLLVLLVGVFIALVRFDLFGLGTNVFGPMISDIPGAQLILPPGYGSTDVTADASDPSSSTDGQTYQYESLAQAVEIIKVTENMLKEKEEEAEKLSEQIDQLQSENKRLKVFEDSYQEYEANKEAFDQFIVDETDPEAFATWYATMSPDNAAKIYGEVVGQQALDDDMKDLVSKIGAMEPADAATVLAEIGVTRLKNVATIIKNLDADKAGDILGAMDPALASRIVVYLYPEQ